MVDGEYSIGNVSVRTTHIERNHTLSKVLHVMSNGGSIANMPLICKIATTLEDKCPWIQKHNYVQKMKEELLKFIPRDIVNEEIMEKKREEEAVLLLDENDDTASECTQSDNVTVESKNILEGILQLGKKPIWNHINSRMVYKYYISDKEALASSFTVAEIDVFNKVIQKFTDKKIFNYSDTKEIKIQKILLKFKGQEMLSNPVKILKSIKSLKDMSYKIVSSSLVLKAVLAASVAHIKCALEIQKWINSVTMPMQMRKDHLNEGFQMFCFPELSEKRNQIEPWTLDMTHMLTNLCTHACKSGFDFFDKEVYLRVSEKDKDLLPWPMITELIDQQNAEIVKWFSAKK